MTMSSPPFLARSQTAEFKRNVEALRNWQLAKLATYGKGYEPICKGPSNITVLAYFFRPPEMAAVAFPFLKCAILETWRLCGAMKTVIVVHTLAKEVSVFAMQYPRLIEIQEEPTLRPGDINSMSIDCITRLYSRFSTDEVLIVQDDGFPLRSGLERFSGRYDFIGAPFRRPFFFIQLLGRVLRDWPSNGGFSLRSRKMCRLVAEHWEIHDANTPFDKTKIEDCYYTQTVPRSSLRFRWKMHIAESNVAFRFSYDGSISIPPPSDVFGFHGAGGFQAIVNRLK